MNMVSDPLLSGWLNKRREDGESTGSLRSRREREWLILGENGSWREKRRKREK